MQWITIGVHTAPGAARLRRSTAGASTLPVDARGSGAANMLALSAIFGIGLQADARHLATRRRSGAIGSAGAIAASTDQRAPGEPAEQGSNYGAHGELIVELMAAVAMNATSRQTRGEDSLAALAKFVGVRLPEERDASDSAVTPRAWVV